MLLHKVYAPESEYVSGLLGNVNTPPPDDDPADLGVCGILEQGRSGDKPWAFLM